MRMEQISERFFNWASILEEQTRAQVQMTSEMPFIYPHIALMPDAHLGKGCAVGAVLPTLGAIMPAAVGVDIGCGMIALRTQFVASQLPQDRRPVREAIESAVPLSAGNYNDAITHEHTQLRLDELTDLATTAGIQARVIHRQLAAAARHAGFGKPLHRGVPGRTGPGMAVPAFRFSWRG